MAMLHRSSRGRRFFLSLLAPAIIACLLPPHGVAQQRAEQQRPKLVVLIAVDQMRADYIQRFHGEWHGGLARLVDHGAWFRNAAYPYSGTETCPGHATMSTGVFPETHGIIGNAWWDRAASKSVTCTQDASVRNVGVDATSSPGDSPAKLLAPSFAERLRSAGHGTRVVTLSLKARAAIMLAGHQGDLVLWQDEDAGDWRTSSAYSAALPDFARTFFAGNPISADSQKVWNLSMPAASYHDDHSTAGENPPSGWTGNFPHALASTSLIELNKEQDYVTRWRTSPFADEYLERLAETTVDSMKLGKGPATDFLGISFSAPDYVGHAYGPNSREIEDEYRRLDTTIGKLLDALDRSVGTGNYVVALTADHGVAPIPEQKQAPGGAGGRVDSIALIARIEKTLLLHLSLARHVAHIVDQSIYFEPGIMDRIRADPALWSDLRSAILETPGILDVFDTEELGQRSGGSAPEKAAALDEYRGRSGDIVLALKPYWVLAFRGTGHGTANDYDQHVPLILYGASVKPGSYTVAASPADIAPTLAAICALPSAKTEGRSLNEAIQIKLVSTNPSSNARP